jgi:GxxExxY protein
VGPGPRETTDEAALAHEMRLKELKFARQTASSVAYEGVPVGFHRLDLPVEDAVVVEVESVENLAPLHEAQLLACLRVTRKRVGLLIDFNSRMLEDGIKRFVLG